MKRAHILVLIVAVLVIFGLTGMLVLRNTQAIVLTPHDDTVTAQGVSLYAQHCAACHGIALEGQPDWRRRSADGKLPAPPHDETGHTWHHSDESLFKLTKFGPSALAGSGYASDMPAYADVLTDAEIIAVLSYIKSTWSKRARAYQEAINERGR